MPVKSSFDCIIIGAGIAGLTAAIYLKRAGKNVVIIETVTSIIMKTHKYIII